MKYQITTKTLATMLLTENALKEIAKLVGNKIAPKFNEQINNDYFDVDVVYNGLEFNAFGRYSVTQTQKSFDDYIYASDSWCKCEELMCNDTDEAIENSLYDLNREIEIILLT